MIVEKTKVSKSSNVYGGWIQKQQRAQSLVQNRLANHSRRSPTPTGYRRSANQGGSRNYNPRDKSPFKSPGQSNLLKSLGPPPAFGGGRRTTRTKKSNKTFTKEDLDRAVAQALADSLAKTTAQMSFNTSTPLQPISPPKQSSTSKSKSKSKSKKPRVQRQLGGDGGSTPLAMGAAAAAGGLEISGAGASLADSPYGALKSVAQKKKKPLTVPPTQVSPRQKHAAPAAPAAAAQMHNPDHPHIRPEVMGAAAAQGLAYVNTGTHNVPKAIPKEHVTLTSGFGNSHLHGNKQVNHGAGPAGNHHRDQLVNQLVATRTAPGGAPMHIVDSSFGSAAAAAADPNSEFSKTVGTLRNRLIDTGGHTLAPHYGHGHEDKDTLDHFGVGMNVGTQGVGEKAEKSMHDHTTNMIDAGKGLISGAVVAPHYGHGHEDKDTYDHFGVGTMMSERGAMSKREQFGEHYGGGHEDKDTFSHMKVVGQANEGFTISNDMQHYGGGHENKDTADHFGLGMMLQDDGAKTHTEDYGHHWKGHENKDTASHMGPGMVPSKDLSFQTGPQHGDAVRPMVKRKGKKKGSGLLPGTMAGRKKVMWQGANSR